MPSRWVEPKQQQIRDVMVAIGRNHVWNYSSDAIVLAALCEGGSATFGIEIMFLGTRQPAVNDHYCTLGNLLQARTHVLPKDQSQSFYFKCICAQFFKFTPLKMINRLKD